MRACIVFLDGLKVCWRGLEVHEVTAWEGTRDHAFKPLSTFGCGSLVLTAQRPHFDDDRDLVVAVKDCEFDWYKIV
jgi:hypothetical protein